MNAPRKITFLQWCRRYLCNFSLIAIVAVLIYILFFTDTSIQDTYRYDKEVARLQHALKAEQDTLDHYRSLNRKLASDPYTLEQLARERYHMQRPHEDVFVVR